MYSKLKISSQQNAFFSEMAPFAIRNEVTGFAIGGRNVVEIIHVGVDGEPCIQRGFPGFLPAFDFEYIQTTDIDVAIRAEVEQLLFNTPERGYLIAFGIDFRATVSCDTM